MANFSDRHICTNTQVPLLCVYIGVLHTG